MVRGIIAFIIAEVVLGMLNFNGLLAFIIAVAIGVFVAKSAPAKAPKSVNGNMRNKARNGADGTSGMPWMPDDASGAASGAPSGAASGAARMPYGSQNGASAGAYAGDNAGGRRDGQRGARGGAQEPSAFGASGVGVGKSAPAGNRPADTSVPFDRSTAPKPEPASKPIVFDGPVTVRSDGSSMRTADGADCDSPVGSDYDNPLPQTANATGAGPVNPSEYVSGYDASGDNGNRYSEIVPWRESIDPGEYDLFSLTQTVLEHNDHVRGIPSDKTLARLLVHGNVLNRGYSWWSLPVPGMPNVTADGVLLLDGVLWVFDTHGYRADADHLFTGEPAGAQEVDSLVLKRRGQDKAERIYRDLAEPGDVASALAEEFPMLQVRPVVLLNPSKDGTAAIVSPMTLPGGVAFDQAIPFVQETLRPLIVDSAGTKRPPHPLVMEQLDYLLKR